MTIPIHQSIIKCVYNKWNLLLIFVLLSFACDAQLYKLDHEQLFLTWTKRINDFNNFSDTEWNEYFKDDFNVDQANVITAKLIERSEIIAISPNERTAEQNQQLKEVQESLVKYEDSFISKWQRAQNQEKDSEGPSSATTQFVGSMEEIRNAAIDILTDASEECKTQITNRVNDLFSLASKDIYQIDEINKKLTSVKSSIDNGARNACELESPLNKDQMGDIASTIDLIENDVRNLRSSTFLLRPLSVSCTNYAFGKKEAFVRFGPAFDKLENDVALLKADAGFISDWLSKNSKCKGEKKDVECADRMEVGWSGNCQCEKKYVTTEDGQCKTEKEILDDIFDELKDDLKDSDSDEGNKQKCTNSLLNIVEDIENQISSFEQDIADKEKSIETLKKETRSKKAKGCEIKAKRSLLNSQIQTSIDVLESYREKFIASISARLDAENCQTYYVHNSNFNFEEFLPVLNKNRNKLDFLESNFSEIDSWLQDNNCDNTELCNKEIEIIKTQLKEQRGLFEYEMKLEEEKIDQLNYFIQQGITSPCANREFLSVYRTIDSRLINNESDPNFTRRVLERSQTEKLKALNNLGCYESLGNEIILLTLELNSQIDPLVLRFENLISSLYRIKNWMDSNPCTESEPKDPNDQEECDPERTTRNEDGSCTCNETYFIEVDGKCFSPTEMEDEAKNEAEEKSDCSALEEKYSGTFDDYLSQVLMLNGLFEAHTQQALLFFTDLSMDQCKNASLATLINQAKDDLFQMEIIKQDLDFLILEILLEGAGCSEEINDLMDRTRPVMEQIEVVGEQWDYIYTRYTQEFNCKEEDIDASSPDLVQDPTRNPTGTILGSGNDIAGDGIDNDGNGIIDDEGPTAGDPNPSQDATLYWAVRLSGSGYRKYFANSIEIVSGSQIIIFTTRPNENIDDILNNRRDDLIRGSERACERGEPALCPCAPWPAIWDGIPQLDILEWSEDRGQLIDKYGCANNTHHGQGGYTCLSWTYVNGTYADLPGNCN